MRRPVPLLFLLLLFDCMCVLYASQLPQLSRDQLQSIQIVGICRAHCLDAFSSRLHIMQSIDNACLQEMSCHQCWENCGMMHNDYKTWGARMCAQESICFEGCQVACSVYRNLHQRGFIIDPPLQRRKFTTELNMIRDTEGGVLSLFWSMPVPIYNEDIASTSLPKCLYAIFWKEKPLPQAEDKSLSDWMPLSQTYEVHYRTRHAELVVKAADFLVLAITRDGLVAEQSLPDKNLTKLTREVATNERVNVDEGTSVHTGPPFLTTRVKGIEQRKNSTTIFIIGVGLTGLICGLFLTIAAALTRVIIRSYRRRRQLTRGYALRKEMDIGHYLSKSLKLNTTTDTAKAPSKGILRKLRSSDAIHPYENGYVQHNGHLANHKTSYGITKSNSVDSYRTTINAADNQVCPMPTPSLVAVHRPSSFRGSSHPDPPSMSQSPFNPASQVYTSTPKAHVSFWTLKSPNNEEGIGSGVIQYGQTNYDSLGASYRTARERFTHPNQFSGIPRDISEDYVLKIVYDEKTGREKVKLRNPEEFVNRLKNQRSVAV